MKAIRSPIEVITSPNGVPARLRWKGEWVQVERRINAWVIQGVWWSDEVRREYMRVLTTIGAVEIYRQGDSWWSSRVLD